tara:strand:- start:1527 stop:2663 length:1137 start_codon:yes stop_codon:yes gene_type:complete
MFKQKILILGDGLTAKLTASLLSKLDLEIELVALRANLQEKNNNRTITISNSNFNFLKKKFCNVKSRKIFWPIDRIKIYDDKINVSELLDFNSPIKNENIAYVGYNNRIQFFLEKQINKNLKTSYLKLEKIKKIIKNKNSYQLILNCTGDNSWISKNYFKNKSLSKKYNQSAITTIIKHNKINNNIARQIFCKEGPLAILPLDTNKSAIVWSVKNNILLDNRQKIKKEFIFKLKNISSNFFLIKDISKPDLHELNFSLSEKYFSNRILNLGDSLHKIHPLAGQGFNMIIRDLEILEQILKSKIDLGLDLGDTTALNEFSERVKYKNFVFANSIDLTHYIFSKKNTFFKKIRNFTLDQINQQTKVKNFFLTVADRGLRF